MVHGVVKAPTLDLCNRDLIASHLHAVWLAAARRSIDTSIAPLLDLNEKAKPLSPELLEALTAPEVGSRALVAAKEVISQVEDELRDTSWFTSDYVEQIILKSAQAFDRAFDRWRALYDATHQQMASADETAKSPATAPADRENAKRRYLDAVNQLKHLLKTGGGQNNDFYTFRYLASQGFLPGYNFPRLPLMAWIPASGRAKSGQDDSGSMVSRPRFLALSEFGPRIHQSARPRWRDCSHGWDFIPRRVRIPGGLLPLNPPLWCHIAFTRCPVHPRNPRTLRSRPRCTSG